MPCNSDYLNQNEREAELQRAAKLLAFVYRATFRKVPKEVEAMAEKYYADVDYIPDLCAEIKAMNDITYEKVVYTGRSKLSRDLADWWETHQQADAKREELELQEKEKEWLKEQGLAKLSPRERRALGID